MEEKEEIRNGLEVTSDRKKSLERGNMSPGRNILYSWLKSFKEFKQKILQ